MASSTSPVARVWNWWLEEVTDMVPPLKRWLRASLPARLQVEHSGGRTLIIDAHTNRPAEEAGPPQALELPEAMVLSRPLTIPRAAISNAAEIAASKLPWETPFETSSAYFGYGLTVDPSKTDAQLTLVAAPKGAVDSLVDEVGKNGHAVDGVGAVLKGSDVWVTLVEPKQKARSKNFAVIALAALLVLALLGPWASLNIQKRHMSSQILQLEPAALEASALRTELRRLTAGQLALSGESDLLVPRTLVLDRLAQLLPTTAWLYRIQIKGGAVELFGFADDPGTFVAALSDSPEFDAVGFLSPTNRDETTSKQRFHIGAQLTGQTP